MLAYYPLEHLYYLLSHSVIPDKIALPSLTAFVPFIRTQPSNKHIPLDIGKLGLWSTRFWAAYVVLQLAHLREDSKLLSVRERTLSKSRVSSVDFLSECPIDRLKSSPRRAQLLLRRKISANDERLF